MFFVILPHQLFEAKYIDKKYNVIIWEHPHYFKRYKYNKKKLILHKASMKYYFDYLKSKKYNVSYVPYDKKLMFSDKYYLFDPIDNIKLPGKYVYIESPNFLLTKDAYSEYRRKTSKFTFNAFYMWSKKLLNIIPDIKSQDSLNRKKVPKDIKIPSVLSNKSKYIAPAIDHVNNHFAQNYGNTSNFIFPVTHKDAKKWLAHFIKYKLKKFGPYQDTICTDNNYLFHSLLSTSINIGLLNPTYIIKKVMRANNIPMNSKEGFIRQLFWREYQRYCNIYYNFNRKNYFGNNKKLTSNWYSGTTNIYPVDNCIIKAFDSGYLHHIERLMIIGNYMNLSEIHPNEGFRWFMEFSCDSYEWVMRQNVLDMVFFVSGGVTMRRPYLSSSNYILKMSNYKRGPWSDTWDKKYHSFIKKNKRKLIKFRFYVAI